MLCSYKLVYEVNDSKEQRIVNESCNNLLQDEDKHLLNAVVSFYYIHILTFNYIINYLQRYKEYSEKG